jgi:hypothetical protein
VAFPGRTSAVEMAKICTLSTGLDTSLSIDMANDLVTELLEPLTREDVDGNEVPYHGTGRLTHIETLLACHFYCLNDPRGSRERVGPLSFEAQSKVDTGLDVTHYGQQAKGLDTSGTLAGIDNQAESGHVARFQLRSFWTGKTYERWREWPATVGRGNGVVTE